MPQLVHHSPAAPDVKGYSFGPASRRGRLAASSGVAGFLSNLKHFLGTTWCAPKGLIIDILVDTCLHAPRSDLPDADTACQPPRTRTLRNPSQFSVKYTPPTSFFCVPQSVSAALVLSVLIIRPVAAQEPNWPHVESTLIAEAASEGYDGMLAVAEVMRARSWNLKPFCASRRKDLAAFVAKQPQYVRNDARRALQAARAGSTTVHHATNFENVEAFGTPAWAKGKVPVATVGHHVFWRLD